MWPTTFPLQHLYSAEVFENSNHVFDILAWNFIAPDFSSCGLLHLFRLRLLLFGLLRLFRLHLILLLLILLFLLLLRGLLRLFCSHLLLLILGGLLRPPLLAVV